MARYPVAAGFLEAFIYLYLVCVGVIWVRLVIVSFYNYRHKFWTFSKIDWVFVAVAVLVPLIPVFNVVMGIHVVSAFWEDGGDPHSMEVDEG